MKRLGLILLLFFNLVLVGTAFALTVDDFSTTENATRDEVVSTITGSAVRELYTVSGGVGGRRVMEALKQSGNLNVELVVQSGLLNHAQDPNTTGDTKVIWDGDDVSPGINPTGLGGINFLQDYTTPDPNTDGFILDVVALDLAPVTITLTVYSSGSDISRLTHTLTSAINTPEELMFLFKDFTPVGANPVDWTKVGAIMLEVKGTIVATDLIIDGLRTNGCNPAVPTASSSSEDQCGVICGKDDCLDCLGKPDIPGTGPNQPGKPCLTGQKGQCSPGTWVGPKPNCTCEPDNNPTDEICDGIDNDCDGDTDENFPDLGGTCSEGEGLCSVNGVYECDGAGGLRCTAEDKKDDIKQCDDSRGCDGVPNSGLVVDECGVCGGDGSSCADCQGTPNGISTLDRCGQCEGDGLSCLECTNFDITELQYELDGNAKEQERIIKRVLRELKRVNNDSSVRSFIAKTRENAHDLQIKNWILSWTLPSVYSECTNTFCVNSSNEPLVVEYKDRSLELKRLGNKAIKRLIKEKQNAGRSVGLNEKRHTKRNKRQHKDNLALADTVPLTVSSCA